MATSKVYLGIAVELAGKTIALEPKNAIDELKTKGIEVELPPGERVYLGTAGGGVRSIMDTLDVDKERAYISEQGNIVEDNLPDIQTLKNLANTLTQARLYVEEFHIRIPGKGLPVLTSAQITSIKALSPLKAQTDELKRLGFGVTTLTTEAAVTDLLDAQSALATAPTVPTVAEIDGMTVAQLDAELVKANVPQADITALANSAAKKTRLKEALGLTNEEAGYTLAMSAEWGPGQGKLVDGVPLELRGIYLKVTNEE